MGYNPADSGEARAVTERVMARVAAAGEWTSADAEEIADAWTDYGSARYDDGAANEREAMSYR